MGVKACCERSGHHWYDPAKFDRCPKCEEEDRKFKRDYKRFLVWLRKLWRNLRYWI